MFDHTIGKSEMFKVPSPPKFGPQYAHAYKYIYNTYNETDRHVQSRTYTYLYNTIAEKRTKQYIQAYDKFTY